MISKLHPRSEEMSFLQHEWKKANSRFMGISGTNVEAFQKEVERAKTVPKAHIDNQLLYTLVTTVGEDASSLKPVTSCKE